MRNLPHPRDLARLLHAQISAPRSEGSRIYTVGGGLACHVAAAAHGVVRFEVRYSPATIRSFSAKLRRPVDCRGFSMRGQRFLSAILEDIACHAEQHPEWLELSGYEKEST